MPNRFWRFVRNITRSIAGLFRRLITQSPRNPYEGIAFEAIHASAAQMKRGLSV